MQPVNKSLHMTFCYQDYELGRPLETELAKLFGKCQELSDLNHYLFKRFSGLMHGISISIDMFSHGGTSPYMLRSLTPNIKQESKLIFVFTNCVGINKEYKRGDLVVLEDSNEILKREVLDRKQDIQGAFPVMTAESMDRETELPRILACLRKGPMTAKEIMEDLNYTIHSWHTVNNTLVKPETDNLWTLNTTDWTFSLTEKGKQEYEKIKVPTETRKPALHIGKSDCTDGLMTSETTKNVDVIEQISRSVFCAPQARDKKARIMQVCVVKCYRGEDIEDSWSYPTSTAQSIMELVKAMTALYAV